VILFQVFYFILRNLGLSAYTCKFIENLLLERQLFTTADGELQGPFLTHKRIAQRFILSPLLFNMSDIGRHLHINIHILQYADDIVLFSGGTDLALTRKSICSSLSSLNSFLKSKGLEISPSKSKSIIFSRYKRNPYMAIPVSVNNTDIPFIDVLNFLACFSTTSLMNRRI